MKTFLFIDRITDEQFFVEAEDKTTANKYACAWFEEPHNCGEVSEEEAESLGYDTY